MTHFKRAMDNAFAQLNVQEACPRHEWGKPVHTIPSPTMLRIYGESWDVKCRLCGRRAGRRTLEQLEAEVINA